MKRVDIECGKIVKEDKDKGIKYTKHDVKILIDPDELSSDISLLNTILLETDKYDIEDVLIAPVDEETLKMIKSLKEDELPKGVEILFSLRDYLFLKVEDYANDPYYIIFDENKFKWVVDMVEKIIDKSENIKDKFSVFLDKLSDIAIPLRERVRDVIYEKYKELVNKALEPYIDKIKSINPESSPPPFFSHSNVI